MRRFLSAVAHALRGSHPEDDYSDTEESVGASEGAFSAGSRPHAHQGAAADSIQAPKPPSSHDAYAVPAAPGAPLAKDALPKTPPRQSSSRMRLELRRIGATPEVVASPSVPSPYNLRSHRRPVGSVRTDSVVLSRPAFMHKQDVENASTTTLQDVCSRFGIEATGGKERMRARILAKMAEKTTDDFSAQVVEGRTRRAPAVAEDAGTEQRANCLTTSTTKKNLASISDPIFRGVGDVHGKSDRPDADVNVPPVLPPAPVESRPARSWMTDRSAMGKPGGQKPPPTPPLTIPNAALPPRGSMSSPLNNPAESMDGSAPLNAGSIFQDWLRTNRRLSTAEYEACVQALRGSVRDGSSLRRPSNKSAGGAASLGVAMVPSAITKRVPKRSATQGLPSPVVANGVRARIPTTPGVRSSSGCPPFSKSGAKEVIQRLPPNQPSQDEAASNPLDVEGPKAGDITSERNTRGAQVDTLLMRLQQVPQPTPVDASSVVARKGGDGTMPDVRSLPKQFTGARGGPNDQNTDRSGALHRGGNEGKPSLDENWLDRLLGDRFKTVPMKENPQYGDMVTPQQLLKHFNESPVPTMAKDKVHASMLGKGSATRKKDRYFPPHPRETVARIRKRNQERVREREWRERLRLLDKQKREEARLSLYKREPIESESGGELQDFRNVLSTKKTVYEIARMRAHQPPASPPLPPRAKRALRFLEALKNQTSEVHTHVRKPDSLPPLPPRLKKVRLKGKFSGLSTFGDGSSSESSTDYERPPDEGVLWKKIRKRQLKELQKLRAKQAREREEEAAKNMQLSVDGTKRADVLRGKEVETEQKEAKGEIGSRPLSEPERGVKENVKDGATQQAPQASGSIRKAFSSPHGRQVGKPPTGTFNPFAAPFKPSLSKFEAVPTNPMPRGTGKAASGKPEKYIGNESNDNSNKAPNFSNMVANNNMAGDLRDPKPLQGENGKESKPSLAQTKPSLAQTKPSLAQTKPSLAQTKPSLAQTKPSFAQTKPSLAQRKPSLVETKPSLAETKPSLAETKPSLAETKPSLAEPKTSDDDVVFSFSAPEEFTPTTSYEFGNSKKRIREENDTNAEYAGGDQNSIAQAKNENPAGSIHISAETLIGKATLGLSKTTKSQRESEMRNASDGVEDEIEPCGSNGKQSNPSSLSSVPAFANSRLQVTRAEARIAVAEGKSLTKATTAHGVFGPISNQRKDHDDRDGTGIAEDVQVQDQAQETKPFGSSDVTSALFGKQTFSMEKPEGVSKQEKANLDNALSQPAGPHPANENKEAKSPGLFAFQPASAEQSKSADVDPVKNLADHKPSEKKIQPPMFSSALAAPSAQQKPSSAPFQKPHATKQVQVLQKSSPLKEKVGSQAEKKLEVKDPPMEKAQEPFTFGVANPAPKSLFGSSSLGSQVNSGNQIGFSKTDVVAKKPSGDAMATMESAADRVKDPKPLFGTNSKVQEAPFGAFKTPPVAPAPLFGSSSTQPPSAPFSFGKPDEKEQKQPGPFGEAKFSSSFKSIGPASSFVFGASDPAKSKSSPVAPAPFAANASNPQATQASANPFAPPSSPPFTAAPTGFGTFAQSQGFSFLGESSSFGPSQPVGFNSSTPTVASNSFGSTSFGNSSNVGFGKEGSKPSFTFGAGAGSAAPSFGTSTGAGAANPFGAPKPSQVSQPSQPSQNAFGASPFGAHSESRPLFGATPSAPFSQGNPFGGNNKTETGFGGRPNEAPSSNNPFNARGGPPSGPGAFAMGSTGAPTTRRKFVKARRTKR